MLKTPFHDVHVQLGAKMVDFAGWEMPLLYTSIVEEHRHTRRVGSIFDVSHMGRIELRGGDVLELLQRVCTRQLADSVVGQCRYSHVCNEEGGILDDIVVARQEDHWLVICNASNRETILAWLQRHGGSMDAEIKDVTRATLMVAVQGPEAMSRLGRVLPLPLAELKRYHGTSGSFMDVPYSIFRTGYTGEDGVELILPAMTASLLAGYMQSLASGEAAGLRLAGLGARDTLRLEAGMPLYGHELHEQVDSLSAGQAWCVDLSKDFIGAEALRRIADGGPPRRLAGLELEGRRIARPGTAVLDADRAVGEVTSGTFAPTLERSIAMAYLDRAGAEPGRTLAVDIGGKRLDAVVVKLPFYKRKK